MINQAVFYLMSHDAHLPYLVCSLSTLRKHWSGPVHVHAWRESWPLVQRIAQDTNLNIVAKLREPTYRGKNDQFIDKIKLAMNYINMDHVIYLDADTTVHGCLSPLIGNVMKHSFVATQFGDWLSNHGQPKNRVERLRQFLEIDQEAVELCVRHPYPSPNGGVWACRPSSPVLPVWLRWTEAARSTFIADEAVLHLMQTIFPPEVFTTMTGGRFNCSPKYQPSSLADDDVAIRHYHGDCNVRRDKSQKGWDLWTPIFSECLVNNVGGMAEWIGRINNKYMIREKLLP